MDLLLHNTNSLFLVLFSLYCTIWSKTKYSILNIASLSLFLGDIDECTASALYNMA